MALPPSSPPLLSSATASEIPSSPPLLPVAIQSYDAPPRKRQRQLEDYDTPSSDPLFSESSGAEDVTGYSRSKRKRMVAGPWWTLKGRSFGRIQDAKDIRNADSGVFMGSDASDASVEYPWSNQGRITGLPFTDRTPRTKMAASNAVLQPEGRARSIVEQCVEEGRETVDLTNLGLTELASTVLQPLHQLIRLSHADSTLPPTEDAFTALVPNIKLFLYGNHLAKIPDAVFELKNITALSIRNNNITHLPSAIANLPKLRELNLTSNAIQCLPFELMQLLERPGNTVSIRPNPLLGPISTDRHSRLGACVSTVDLDKLATCRDPWAQYRAIKERAVAQAGWDPHSELRLRLALGRALQRLSPRHSRMSEQTMEDRREELVYLGSSAVQLCDLDGSPYGKAQQTAIVLDEGIAMAAERRSAASVAPSLFELTLRTVQRNYDLSVVPDDLPPRIRASLLKAREAAPLGNQKCSTCGREYIIFRAHWLEYWFNGPTKELTLDAVLPFIRKVCSLGCIKPTPAGSFR